MLRQGQQPNAEPEYRGRLQAQRVDRARLTVAVRDDEVHALRVRLQCFQIALIPFVTLVDVHMCELRGDEVPLFLDRCESHSAVSEAKFDRVRFYS